MNKIGRNMTSNQYIELDRRYNLKNKYDIFSIEEIITDVDQIDNAIVLILGDKGSGKTTEILNYIDNLNNKSNNSAFFFKLDDLSRNYLYDENDNFANWLKTHKKAYIFLDSVDECRLNNDYRSDNFEKALIYITNRIADISKCTFIITSRESDWDEEKDSQTALKYLTNKIRLIKPDNINLHSTPIELKVTANSQLIKTYILKSLDTIQFKKIIKHHLPTNFDHIIDKFENISDAFFATPMECIDIVKYYKRYNALPENYEDFFNFKLFSRYRELNKAHSSNQMSIEKIKYLSQRLAIGTILCKKPSILKEESYDTNLDFIGNSLSLHTLFPDEEDNDLKKYINSSLFASNGNQKVKFYNEYLKNYVAFLWLKERIDNNKYKEIKRLLFNYYKDLKYKYFPKKSLLLPIVMLADKNFEIKKLLIEHFPEILIAYSEYCYTLNNLDREQIFNNLFTNFKYRIPTLLPWHDNDNQRGLSHFADKSLFSSMLKIFKNNNYYEQYIIIYLLKNIECSQINQKIKTDILYFVLSNNFDGVLLEETLNILSTFNDKETENKLKEYLLKNQNKIHSPSLDILINKLYPNHISFDDILNIWLHYSDNDHAIRLRDIHFIIKNFISNFISNDNDKLIKILSLLEYNDDIKTWHLTACIQSFLFLIKNNFNIEKIINHLVFFQKKLDSIEHNYDIEYHIKDDIKKLREVIVSNNFHNIFCQKLIIDYYLKEKSLNAFFFNIYDMKIYTSNITILEPLLEITKNPDIDNKKQEELLNDILIYLIQDKKDENKETISHYLISPEKQKIWNDFYNFKASDDPANLLYNQKRKALEEENKQQEQKDVDFLNTHIDDLKNAKKNMFRSFYYITSETQNTSTSFNNVDFNIIKEKFGQQITDAYIQGIQKYWQICDFNNQDLIESIKTKKILSLPIVTIPGITLFLKNNPDIKNLSSEQAKRIIYFGIQELNKFPEWFEQIAIQYKKEAEEIINPIIKQTLTTASEEDSYTLITRLTYLSSQFIDIFYDFTFNLIKNGSLYPKNIIKETVKFLLNSNRDKYDIILFITNQLDYKNPTSNMPLYQILFKYNSDIFVEAIKKQLNYIKDDFLLSKNFIKNLCAILHTDDNSKNGNQFKMKQLNFLIPILFKYIPPEEDPEHESGIAYTLNKDDEATDFRNKIFSAIRTILNEENLNEAINLSKKIKNINYKNHLLLDIYDFLIDDSTELVLKETDIIKIENDDYMEPQSCNDLFRIVCDKLDDIKDEIETSDYSFKELYHHLSKSKNITEKNKIKNEIYFQKYMLMEFRRLSKNLYSIVREPEVINRKKPDLQIWHRSWCVNIECKIIDSWSGNKLKEAIKKQLIDQYLKHSKYQYGILLLARIKPNRKFWKLNNRNLSYTELLHILQQYANEQKTKYSHIKDIKIFSIDYSL